MEKLRCDDGFEEPEYPVYQTSLTTWQGIDLQIRYCSHWLCNSDEMIAQHIEIRSMDKSILPITETGYRSHFLNGQDALSDFGNDPVAFVLYWLDEAAKSKE